MEGAFSGDRECEIVTLEDLDHRNAVIVMRTPEHSPRSSSKLFSVIMVRL